MMNIDHWVASNPAARRLYQTYSGLSHRDQTALKLLAVFGLVVIVVYGVVIPSQHFNKEAQQRYIDNRDTLVWMKANRQAAEASRQSSKGLAGGDSLLNIANTSAKAFQLAVKRVEPVGENGLSIWLENIPFNNVILWLDSMTKRYGIAVKEISVDQAGEKSGLVNIRLVITG